MGELAKPHWADPETNLSQHMSRLAAAGLVGPRREGTMVYYRIADKSLGELFGLVSASLWVRGRSVAAS